MGFLEVVEPAVAFEWLERMGGWAVVLIVVRWLLSRMDRVITGYEESLTSFRTFEIEERETHRGLLDALAKITDNQKVMFGELLREIRVRNGDGK